MMHAPIVLKLLLSFAVEEAKERNGYLEEALLDR